MPVNEFKKKSINDLISLKGKTALITGAASGIGRAIANIFSESGSDLILVDINEDGLKDLKEELKKFNTGVITMNIDLSKKEEIVSLWKNIADKDPDILVNNAGIYIFKDFLETDIDFLDLSLNINLKSVYLMCQEFISLRLKKGKGGTIINIGSIEAILPFAKGLVHYDISKAGVIALTRALAREYGKKGFKINVIVPGGINTKSIEKLKKEALIKFKGEVIQIGISYFTRLPLGRMGEPEEVARVALFLATDLSSYVHGALIPVDGGFLST